MAKPIYTTDQITTMMTHGNKWSGDTISFSFLNNLNGYSGVEKPGFNVFSDYQKEVARAAIETWDDLIAPNLKEVASGGLSDSNIKFGNSSTGVGYGHAYYPGSNSWSGAVFLNSAYDASTGINNLMTPKPGAYGYKTYVHEIGHSLGLNHPGNYNGAGATYELNATFFQDTRMYSIMSYFSSSITGGAWYGYEPQTPMLYDIATIQKIYGADLTTRTGDTTYGFNASTDIAPIYDFSKNLNPIMTIYDAGGIDTLDVSGWIKNAIIDLNPGKFSSFNGMKNNLAIAFNTGVENATTGAGADILTGNALDNVLKAGAGADILVGGDGNDTLDGGLGIDKMTGGKGNDFYFVDDIKDLAVEASNQGTDTVKSDLAAYILTANLENLVLGETAISGTGNGLGNIITGNALDNTLLGGAGNDTLEGGLGIDTLKGDAGNDIINAGEGYDSLFGGAGNDVMNGDAGIDSLLGEVGNDIMNGGEGDDKIDGGAGNDALDGGLGNDALIGGVGNDTMTGDEGDDSLLAGAGNDTLFDGAGADILNGDAGNDLYVLSDDLNTIIDASGLDTIRLTYETEAFALATGFENFEYAGGSIALTGNTLANKVWTGAGNDVIATDLGNDRIDSGLGTDRLTGGLGSDIFVLSLGKTADDYDVITDFVDGADKLSLAGFKMALGYTGSNMVLDGYVQVQQGEGCLNIVLDHDGKLGSNTDFDVLCQIEGSLLASKITAADFVYV